MAHVKRQMTIKRNKDKTFQRIDIIADTRVDFSIIQAMM